MSEMQFCYCCRVHHPKVEMRRFATRTGVRWRCLRSIEAAMQNIEARDSFGCRQTEINRDLSRCMAESDIRLHYQRMQSS